MKKTFLITGATGFLGSYLAAELLRRGHVLSALSRPKGGATHDERLRRALRAWRRGPSDDAGPGRLTILEGDVKAPDFGLPSDALDGLHRAGVEVIHCAASTSFDGGEPADEPPVNVLSARNLVRLSRKICARAVHYVSTAYVAGDFRGPFAEGDLQLGQGFRNDYERTKHAAEVLVRGFAQATGTPLNVFRPSIIMGESGTGKTTNFNTFYPYFRIISSVREKFEGRLAEGGRALGRLGIRREDGVLVLPLRVAAAPRTEKNIVPVDFVAEAVAAVAEGESEGTRTFHLTNPEPLALARLNEEFNAALGVKGVTLVDESDFEAQGPNFLESLVRGVTKVYRPYLQEEPDFRCEATHAALERLGVRFPDLLGAGYYRKLARFGASVAEADAAAPEADAPPVALYEHLRGRVGRHLVPDVHALDARFSIHLSDLDTYFSLSIERGILTELLDRRGSDDVFSFVLASDTLDELVGKKVRPQEAFFASRIEIEGDMEKALSLAPIFDEFFASLGPL